MRSPARKFDLPTEAAEPVERLSASAHVVAAVLAHQFDVPSHMRTCRENRAPRIIASSTMLFIHDFAQFAFVSDRNDTPVSAEARSLVRTRRDVVAEERP